MKPEEIQRIEAAINTGAITGKQVAQFAELLSIMSGYGHRPEDQCNKLIDLSSHKIDILKDLAALKTDPIT